MMNIPNTLRNTRNVVGLWISIAATLLDSCMGCAIHSLLPAGVGYSTTDLQVRYSRGMTVETGRVLAEGTVVHAGRRLATAEGRLTAAANGRGIHGFAKKRPIDLRLSF